MDKPFVRVVWIDASDPKGDESWYTDAEIDAFGNKACQVVSTGYLKTNTKLYITLVSDYIINDDGTITWGRPTKIPHGMAQSIEEIPLPPIKVDE